MTEPRTFTIGDVRLCRRCNGRGYYALLRDGRHTRCHACESSGLADGALLALNALAVPSGRTSPQAGEAS